MHKRTTAAADALLQAQGALPLAVLGGLEVERPPADDDTAAATAVTCAGSFRAALEWAAAEVIRVNGLDAAQIAALSAADGVSSAQTGLDAQGGFDLDRIGSGDPLALDVLESSWFPRLLPQRWCEDDPDGALRYRCAWLKARFPAELLAALMECADDPAGRQAAVAEAQRTRLPVLSPDVNSSGAQHRVQRLRGETKGIRRPLAPAQPLSQRDWDRLREGRPYRSVAEVDSRAALSLRTMEGLAQSGAFDVLVRADAAGGDCATGGDSTVRASALGRVRELAAARRVQRRHTGGARRAQSGQLELLGEAELPAAPALLAPGERPSLQTPPSVEAMEASPDRAVGHDADGPAGAAWSEEDEAQTEPSADEADVQGDEARTEAGWEEIAPAEPAQEWFRGGEIAERYAPLLRELEALPLGSLRTCREGSEVVVAGAPVRTSHDAGAQLSLEDGSGRVQGVCSEDMHLQQLSGLSAVLLRGRLSLDDAGPPVLVIEDAQDLTQLWRDWTARPARG